MNNFTFDAGDFSIYNKSGHTNCNLTSNGKVDLIPKTDGKIGLTERGMFHLTKAWIETYTPMNRQYVEELIKLLNDK